MMARLGSAILSVLFLSILSSCGTYKFETTSTDILRDYLESNRIEMPNASSFRMHREYTVPILTTLETLPSIMLFKSNGCRIPQKVTCSTIGSTSDMSSLFAQEDNQFQATDCDGINNFGYYSKQFLDFNNLSSVTIEPDASRNKVIVLWAAMDKRAYKEDLRNLVETLKEEKTLEVFYINLDWTPMR